MARCRWCALRFGRVYILVVRLGGTCGGGIGVAVTVCGGLEMDGRAVAANLRRFEEFQEEGDLRMLDGPVFSVCTTASSTSISKSELSSSSSSLSSSFLVDVP